MLTTLLSKFEKETVQKLLTLEEKRLEQFVNNKTLHPLEVGLYCLTSTYIIVLWIFIYVNFIGNRYFYLRAVLDGACESRALLRPETDIAGQGEALSGNLDILNNGLDLWEEKAFLWKRMNMSDWSNVGWGTPLYSVRVFGVKDNICVWNDFDR